MEPRLILRRIPSIAIDQYKLYSNRLEVQDRYFQLFKDKKLYKKLKILINKRLEKTIKKQYELPDNNSKKLINLKRHLYNDRISKIDYSYYTYKHSIKLLKALYFSIQESNKALTEVFSIDKNFLKLISDQKFKRSLNTYNRTLKKNTLKFNQLTNSKKNKVYNTVAKLYSRCHFNPVPFGLFSFSSADNQIGNEYPKNELRINSAINVKKIYDLYLKYIYSNYAILNLSFKINDTVYKSDGSFKYIYCFQKNDVTKDSIHRLEVNETVDLLFEKYKKGTVSYRILKEELVDSKEIEMDELSYLVRSGFFVHDFTKIFKKANWLIILVKFIKIYSNTIEWEHKDKLLSALSTLPDSFDVNIDSFNDEIISDTYSYALNKFYSFLMYSGIKVDDIDYNIGNRRNFVYYNTYYPSQLKNIKANELELGKMQESLSALISNFRIINNDFNLYSILADFYVENFNEKVPLNTFLFEFLQSSVSKNIEIEFSPKKIQFAESISKEIVIHKDGSQHICEINPMLDDSENTANSVHKPRSSSLYSVIFEKYSNDTYIKSITCGYGKMINRYSGFKYNDSLIKSLKKSNRTLELQFDKVKFADFEDLVPHNFNHYPSILDKSIRLSNNSTRGELLKSSELFVEFDDSNSRLRIMDKYGNSIFIQDTSILSYRYRSKIGKIFLALSNHLFFNYEELIFKIQSSQMKRIKFNNFYYDFFPKLTYKDFILAYSFIIFNKLALKELCYSEFSVINVLYTLNFRNSIGITFIHGNKSEEERKIYIFDSLGIFTFLNDIRNKNYDHVKLKNYDSVLKSGTNVEHITQMEF
jgi:hypothetical protein